MSAPSTSSLSILLSRVIDVKYGCFTFYLFLRARYRDLVFLFNFCVVSVVAFFVNSHAQPQAILEWVNIETFHPQTTLL